MALECKVSNSALNSVKRLIRETGGKARSWRNAFGLQIVTGAVLAGVYKLGNLLDAQQL
ncbi:MAG: XamI family restriction endonuclease [Actinomycetota bacterium]